MVQSVLIICDDSPVGKNSAAEAIRMGSGFAALGEELECEIIFKGEAVYLFNKNANPKAVNMDSAEETIMMADLSDLKIGIVKDALKKAGMTKEDLIDYENLEIITEKELALKIENFETCYRI
jgi:sulfur relay (sulfurtransferase) DsrF/TusC family protein